MDGRTRSRALSGNAAPTHLLQGAAAAVVAGALLILTDPVALHVVGYVLGSVVAIGLLVSYVRVDAARRNRPGYRALKRPARVGSLLAVAGVLVAAAHAWALATRLAG